jgi:hypothetical protein
MDEMTPRAAIIALIRDRLEDEHGRDFVEAAVTTFSYQLVARARTRRLPLTDFEKEFLAFAYQILDDGGQ